MYRILNCSKKKKLQLVFFIICYVTMILACDIFFCHRKVRERCSIEFCLQFSQIKYSQYITQLSGPELRIQVFEFFIRTSTEDIVGC